MEGRVTWAWANKFSLKLKEKGLCKWNKTEMVG